MGQSDRIDEIHKIYGWNLTLKSLCSSPKDIDEIIQLDFGTILTYLELNKAEEELTYIGQELIKNKYKNNG